MPTGHGCPRGYEWDGSKCVSIHAGSTGHGCPPGHVWNGSKCVPKVVNPTQASPAPPGQSGSSGAAQATVAAQAQAAAAAQVKPPWTPTQTAAEAAWAAAQAKAAAAAAGGSDPPDPQEDEDPSEETPPDEETPPEEVPPGEEVPFDNDLFMLYKDTLEQFGFSGEAFDDFLKLSVAEDWNDSTFKIKMRQQDWYLANPLYAANIARSKAGGLFMSEGQVLGYANSARDLARHWGYTAPSDNYIAMAIQGGMSPAEFEHRLTVQDRINQFGGGVAMVYKALMGHDPTDQDLFEIFDPEISRKDFDDKAMAAEMRGRPLLLGLGIRDETEFKALQMLGVTPEQAWQGYQKLAGALPHVSKLAAIDQAIANDPNNPFDSFGALFGDIFRSDPKSQEALMLMMAREQARFKTGGGPAANQQGQLVGLLSGAEKQTYG